ncbi:M48 family metalloprotease [Amycolatopsis sp. FDAARGOS 1241]|uniref:M48 family metalloprotease n=1 Tax=Amycolatopsis sp. FDAARGOS 1241 TaxID=2778070 RepID=UPI001951B12D|nr:M48 family metallopeptidase [Amycolatopsis sp. FDAARGOS 1241]QRP46506.1 M48 family metalloprotease [Amycolatopsis sp. FDAARGOS 1241]
MKNSSRALLAVVLLAGFPVLVLLIVAAIVALEIYAFQDRPATGVRLAIFAVPAVYVLLQALFTIERARDDDVSGLPLTPEAQPELWAVVRELADAVGTRPPDEIYLVPEVNAAVQEQTRWLGLRVKRRRMFIGAQLFAGLRTDQLRSVLGHELGHYSNRDTRFGGATYRGRQAIGRVVGGLIDTGGLGRYLRPLFKGYAKLYFTVSMRVSRDQELAADAAAARVAGTAAATSALREIEALEVLWRFFINTYATIGWRAGYLPARLAEGYRQLLADEHRAEELAEVRRNPPQHDVSPYDSHPATLERIAVLEAAPRVPVLPGGARPAAAILRNAEAVLDAGMLTGLSDEARKKKRTDWQTVVDVGMRNEFFENAGKIARGRSMSSLLDALDNGKLDELADPDVKVPANAGPRARRELLGASARTRLSIVVTSALAASGAARWRLSWSGPAELVLAEPYGESLTPALDAAVAGDTRALRALLSATDPVLS